MGATAHPCNKVTDLVVYVADGRLEVKNVKCRVLHTDTNKRQRHKGQANWSIGEVRPQHYTHHADIEWFE